MHRLLSKIGLGLALLTAASAATSGATAWVYQNGPAFIIDQDSVGSGRASAELGGGGSDGAGSYAYVGSAYADTRHGALGVAATASGTGYDEANDRLVVHSEADFAEALTFSGPGLVTVRLAVQGSFATAVGGQVSSFARLSVSGTGQSPATARTFWRGGLSRMDLNTNQTVVSRLPSNYIVWLETTFSAIAGIPMLVQGHLDVTTAPPVNGVAQALFDHTAQLSLQMPEGVTFTSESGDFLADAASPVPEPGTITMWLAGLLLLGTSRPGRRRRSATATAAATATATATAAACGS